MRALRELRDGDLEVRRFPGAIHSRRIRVFPQVSPQEHVHDGNHLAILPDHGHRPVEGRLTRSINGALYDGGLPLRVLVPGEARPVGAARGERHRVHLHRIKPGVHCRQVEAGVSPGLSWGVGLMGV